MEMVTFINEGKREAESFQRLRQISVAIIGAESLNLAVPSRKLIAEGTVRRVGESSKLTLCKIFLFSDLFLWAKESKNKFIMQGTIQLPQLKFIDVADTEEVSNIFELADKSAPDVVVTIAVNSKAEKDKWMKDLKGLIKEYQIKGLKALKQP